MISVFVSYTEDFDEVAEVTLPPLRTYCQLHGYDLTIHRGGFGKRERMFCFQKTELALYLLYGCEYLFVLDIDTMVTNASIKLEGFVDSDHYLFACEDVNGLNAGAYIVRNCKQAHNMLQFVVAYGHSAPEGHGDQNGLNAWIKWNSEGYKAVPHPAFNSYLYEEYQIRETHENGQWAPGDFLLHLPGIKNERRIELFKSIWSR